MMDGLEIVSKMQILIKDRLQSVGDTMITGGVDNMEKYQYMLGQARTYQYLLQVKEQTRLKHFLAYCFFWM